MLLSGVLSVLLCPLAPIVVPLFDTVLLSFCCGWWWWWFGFGDYAVPSFILCLLNPKWQVKRNPNLYGDPGYFRRVPPQIVFFVHVEYLEP